MTRLLVSVRGPNEAEVAIRAGAHIVDVEFPDTALGTPYPLNIRSVMGRIWKMRRGDIPVSTNIGEVPEGRSRACLAALGVATAGVEYIKCGLATCNFEQACYLGDNLVRTVRTWYPAKKVYPVLFPDADFEDRVDPLEGGAELVEKINSDGILIDTYNKEFGVGLLDIYKLNGIRALATELHANGRELWVAGSVKKNQVRSLAEAGVDVICVRGAACEPALDGSRMGAVSKELVSQLVYELRRN